MPWRILLLTNTTPLGDMWTLSFSFCEYRNSHLLQDIIITWPHRTNLEHMVGYIQRSSSKREISKSKNWISIFYHAVNKLTVLCFGLYPDMWSNSSCMLWPLTGRVTENLEPEQGQHKTSIPVPESEEGTRGQPFYGKHNAQTTVTPSWNLI